MCKRQYIKVFSILISLYFLITNAGYCKDKYGLVKEVYKRYGDVWKVIEYELDFKGRKIYGIEYNDDGEVRKEIEYEYNYKGKLINEIWFNEYFEDGIDYKYDDGGNLIKKTEYSIIFNKEYGRIIREYEYDKNGNMVVESWEIGDRKITREYQYNKKGAKIGGQVRIDNEVTAILEYKYNKKGNLETVTAIGVENNEEAWKDIYEYDKKGNLIIEDHRTASFLGEPGILKVYEYDDIGNKRKELLVIDEEIEQEIYYEYKIIK